MDSRLAVESNQVRRRRECGSCNERFTTFETAELNLPRIVKRDGRIELFNESKLGHGVMLALEKRPVSSPEIDAALARIRHRLLAYSERDVPSYLLGEWVMDELRALDQVAYVRFASVYRSFQDVQAFREEIDRLTAEPTPEQRRRQISLLDDEGSES